jgi:VanZ family protein
MSVDKYDLVTLPKWGWLKPTPIAITYSVLLMAAMFVPVPHTPLDEMGFPVDKIIHLFLFSILYLLWTWAFRERKRGLITAAWVAIAIGMFTEIVQGFLPWRSFEYHDLIGDGLGILIGFLLMKLRFRLR